MHYLFSAPKLSGTIQFLNLSMNFQSLVFGHESSVVAEMGGVVAACGYDCAVVIV